MEIFTGAAIHGFAAITHSVVAFPGHLGTGYTAYTRHEYTAPNHIPRCFRGGLGRPPR